MRKISQTATGVWAGAFLAGLYLSTTMALAQSSVQLVPPASDWRYFKGFAEASQPDPTAWREIGFDDTDIGWLTGQAPFFYENGTGFTGNTDLTDMFGGYSCIFMRRTFELSGPNAVEDLILDVQSDDGCIVWINGVEVARINVPAGEIPYNGTSGPAAGEPNTLNQTLADKSMLVAGENVLAVQALNSSIGGSSDFIIEASLTGTIDQQSPFIERILPPATAVIPELVNIEVLFNEDVTGADASDLLINGTPATELTLAGPNQLLFSFPQPPTGAVSVAFIENHGITDTSPLANPFGGMSWSYTLNPNAEPPGVIISEFMASNDDTLNDEDGDSSDWIELYNAGISSVSLDGWFLTDDPDNLTKWRIPAVVLNANGFLVIFASSKDRSEVPGELHTNFGLGAGGEFLALVNPQTNIVSQFAPEYPAQFTDISYGRDNISPSIVGYFETPTPGDFNSASGANVGPEVVFSMPSRTYFDEFDLVLSTPSNPSAEIRYVIVDAPTSATVTNVPTPVSTLYTAPIPISGTMQVRARSFVPNNLPGPGRSESYIQMNENLRDFSSDLPLVVVHNFGSGEFPDNSTAAAVDDASIVMIFDTKFGRSSLTNLPDTAGRAGINIRGSSTQGYPKRSYGVEFWDELNQDLERPVLDFNPESDFVLYAPNQFDLSRMHNPLAYELSNDIGQWASHTRYVETFMNISGGPLTGPVPAGNYHGIYVLEERIKRDNGRIDIDRLEVENNEPPEVTGGYVLKVDRVDWDERTFSAGGLTIIYQDPDSLDMITPQWSDHAAYIQNYINNMRNAINNGTYEDWIDVRAWIDHHLINVLTINVDAMRLSGFMHKPRDVVDRHGVVVEPGKFRMGPVWDFDRSAGSTRGEGFGGLGRPWSPLAWMGQSSSATPTSGDPGTSFFTANGVFSNPWYSVLFLDLDFWQLYIDRYQELRETSFSKEHITGIIDRMADEMREANVRDQQRWGGQGASNITPRNGLLSDFGFSHTFDGTWQGEVDFQKKWFEDRIDFIDSEFLDRPFFSDPGGSIEPGFELIVTGPPGATIYYTLDGTDPRAPGGGVAAGAQAVTGPIVLNGNARVVARSFDESHNNMTGTGPNGINNPRVSSHWSGPRAGTFVVSAPSIRITELMYHPAAPDAGSELLEEDFEYLEVKNVGGATVNLAGYRLRGGIDFTFPSLSLAPGEAAVVVSHEPTFVTRYGTGVTVAGSYRGLLNNAGEDVILEGRLGEVIHDFEFDDDWHPATDGFGFALVIRDENGALENWNVASGWRAGTLGGTPGMDEPSDPAIPVVYVNEALTHTDAPDVDFIELYNPNNQSVDVGGWFLSDDFRTPKFEIPGGTTIPAQGYVVFTEEDFNVGGDPNAFNLRSSGDEVYLYSGDGAGNLTGYVHGYDFGASLNGISFGRYINSVGEEHFVAQAANSMGAANVGPRVGPVVISEVMYHPPAIAANGGKFENFRDEFVELVNITGSAVSLFDPNAPTNTWQLRDAVDYVFPPGESLGAGERILVVPFDPATNAPATAAFRSLYSVDPSVRLFGPFDGRLNNAGESVELIQPDLVRFYTTNIVITGVLIDAVDYEPSGNWPRAADGFGPSLQRIVLNEYGDDPVNWVAATPTAGDSYELAPAPEIVTQPQSQTTVAFMDLTLSVQATGQAPLRYQWLFNGAPIEDATNAVLTLERVPPTAAGNYQVVVMAPGNSVVSDVAVVTLLIPANITNHPGSRTVLPGQTVTFSVTATSSTPITYQWRKGGVPIEGATQAIYTIENVQAADRGTYDVVVTDEIGPVVSNPAQLEVLVPPIVARPTGRVDLRVVQGSDVLLGIEISTDSTLPLGYRWRRGFSLLTQQVGAGYQSFVLLENVQPATISFNTNITVTITNIANSAPGVTATNTLVVLPDSDGDGMADEFEDAFGLTVGVDDSNGDLDGDGFTNFEESIAGTDPSDENSFLKVEDLGVDAGAEITFQAAVGRSYTIYYKDNLSSLIWEKLADVVPGEGGAVTVTDLSGSSQRYYQLVTPRQE